MNGTIEHPPKGGITIRPVSNSTNAKDGSRQAFGSSWLVVVPAKRTHGEGRQRKQFDDLASAKLWAEEQDKGLKRQGTAYLELDVVDALAAMKMLPDGKSLLDAAKFYHERKAGVEAILVLDAIEKLLEEKRQDGLSVAHVNDLRLRLKHFAIKFGTLNTSDLDAKALDGWLRGLKVSARSRVNYRRVVFTFLKFCERRRWLARGAIEASSIVAPKVKSSGPVEIFSCAELRMLLEASGDKLRPFFVLGGLCGLRTAEALRLEWGEIDFERGFIRVEAHKAKTASRRLVPIGEAAKQWLLPLRKPSGRVLPYHHVAKEVVRLVHKLNRGRSVEQSFAWKSNALRHSYISARLAIIKDAAKVALECGNSPAMIFQHYRELLHEDIAAQWFDVRPNSQAAIAPGQPANVTPFASAVA